MQKKGKLDNSYKDLREIVDRIHQPLVKLSRVFEYIAQRTTVLPILQTGNDPQTGPQMIPTVDRK